MNAKGGCPKGHKKCLKNCHQPEKCVSCPYLKECCNRYCLRLQHTSTGTINEGTGRIKTDPFVEGIERIIEKA